uniref:DNA topoisomerase I n=1 Tax=Lepeophtheirus salmonis TaxID=72036 RepID=A0A0K2TK98_LEPSM
MGYDHSMGEEVSFHNHDEEMKMEQQEQQVKDEPQYEEELHEEQDEFEEDRYNNAKQENMEVEVKVQDDSEDDIPLAKKSKNKKRKSRDEDSEDDVPLSKRKKPKVKKVERVEVSKKSKSSKKNHKVKHEVVSPTKSGGRKKKEDKVEVWKWWEEEKVDDGTKWKFLQHRGPLFAPDYDRLPKGVHFYYNDKKMKLSSETEEVAGFYARMIEHEYTEKEVFNRNFFKDWRKVMTREERDIITNLSKCDFREINTYYKKVSEERKNRSKEEKKAEKEKNAAIQDEFGICVIDNHNEKIGNFRIEPPGLFRGRGEHPKQGMLKRRVVPEDVIINCSKDSKFPEPPPGHRWKEVRHDNTVTWLASWTENIQNQIKYVMLNPSSKLKGEKDMLKYEKARELKSKIEKIRDDYTVDFKSKEMRVRQRSVALYFIDKLALRAGNEKDEDQADTVGCCSLRVEHITLHTVKDGKDYCVEFDFLGKDSIRYHNIVPVEKRVFKNVQLFMENKRGEDDLFDRLNTTILNEYLNSLMKGLTAKVFRTFNASFTLQDQLEELTEADDNVPAKMLSYNRANRKVAILCNHQRAAPKTHDKSMQNLQDKIKAKREAVEKAEKDLKQAKKAYKNGGSTSEKVVMDKKKKALERTVEQLDKLETQAVDKEENKTIALGTSKLNYLDPRISVAWSKKFDVPIEKVYNKTQRDKFRWAIEMAGADYVF